jgi:hypothetical protein
MLLEAVLVYFHPCPSLLVSFEAFQTRKQHKKVSCKSNKNIYNK